MRAVRLIASALLLWITGIAAEPHYYGIDYNAAAAYFTFQDNGVDEYVFALNVVDNGDVYFHMSGPVVHTWIGVGFGTHMKDSFMLIAYPSADGLNTTISPRVATGHTEPRYVNREIIKVYNDTYAPNANTVTEKGLGTIIAHAVCVNCSTWDTGTLNTKTTSQPFIFALGPDMRFRSDSPEASIPRHSFVGQFEMDMTKATNYSGWYGRIPAPNVPHFIFPPNDTAFASSNSIPAFHTLVMNDPLPGAHAAVMCVSFVLLFPLGALVMQLLKKVLWHAAIQVIGFVLVFAGLGIACQFSHEYTKSENYTSGHQVFGFIILALLCVQLGLGLLHHAIYVRSQSPTPFGRIHFFLGPTIIVFGIINGGVGFHFADNHALIVPYAVVVAVLALVFFGIIGFSWMCMRRQRKYKPEPEDNKEPQLSEANYNEYELGRKPTFGEQVPEPYEQNTPYSPGVPAEYTPTTPYTPYTPLSAYTPITPRTWKKEEISNWPSNPFRDEEGGV